MADLFLSRDEVAELTGARRREGQVRALSLMGVPFELPPDGWPRVARARFVPEAPQEPALGMVRR